MTEMNTVKGLIAALALPQDAKDGLGVFVDELLAADIEHDKLDELRHNIREYLSDIYETIDPIPGFEPLSDEALEEHGLIWVYPPQPEKNALDKFLEKSKRAAEGLGDFFSGTIFTPMPYEEVVRMEESLEEVFAIVFDAMEAEPDECFIDLVPVELRALYIA